MIVQSVTKHLKTSENISQIDSTRATVNTNRKATGGLSNLTTPFDPQILRYNPQNLFECHEVIRLGVGGSRPNLKRSQMRFENVILSIYVSTMSDSDNSKCGLNFLTWIDVTMTSSELQQSGTSIWYAY